MLVHGHDGVHVVMLLCAHLAVLLVVVNCFICVSIDIKENKIRDARRSGADQDEEYSSAQFIKKWMRGMTGDDVSAPRRRQQSQQRQSPAKNLPAVTGVRRRSMPTARRIHAIDLKKYGGTGGVHSVATRANKLYVGRYLPTIEIYDTSTFQLIGGLNFSYVGCIVDVASCPHCDVVYAADWCYNVVHVIDDQGVRRQFDVGPNPIGLSVNAQSNVLVTLIRERKLREYTSSGELVREITLQADLVEPHHAIQLDSDRYVVSHGNYFGDLIRVCVINGSGQVIECYGGTYGSGAGHMSTPHWLALFRDSVIVADQDNYMILLLKLTPLTLQGELINVGESGERYPGDVEMSEDGTRLYVAEGYFRGDNYVVEIDVYDLSSD